MGKEGNDLPFCCTMLSKPPRSRLSEPMRSALIETDFAASIIKPVSKGFRRE
jgi:hypothetical protein